MLKFISQYVKEPKSIGAFAPSSSYLTKRMIAQTDITQAKCIVEFGAGTGPMTEQLLRHRSLNTTLISFEINPIFVEQLQHKYAYAPDFYIENRSADEVLASLQKYGFSEADYIFSGLPFASLPESISLSILRAAASALKPDGKLILFQYTPFKKSMLEGFFKVEFGGWEACNFPPAIVYNCSVLEAKSRGAPAYSTATAIATH